jgi:proteasome lid subunit RPN8/RPN11
MRWSDVKPDAQPARLRDALSEMDVASAIRFRMNLANGIRLYVEPACRQAVLAHVRSDIREVGGLLLGRVWRADPAVSGEPGPIVLIEESLPSEVFSNSAVSLEMGTEIWNRAGKRTVNGVMVVGWYHSHPNLGAFFSGTDRRTQAAFFKQPYSVGWVIDPFRREERVFMGAESDEYLPRIEDLALAVETESAGPGSAACGRLESGCGPSPEEGEPARADQPIQD